MSWAQMAGPWPAGGESTIAGLAFSVFEAVKGWRWEPALKAGKPVPVGIPIQVYVRACALKQESCLVRSEKDRLLSLGLLGT